MLTAAVNMDFHVYDQLDNCIFIDECSVEIRKETIE